MTFGRWSKDNLAHVYLPALNVILFLYQLVVQIVLQQNLAVNGIKDAMLLEIII